MVTSRSTVKGWCVVPRPKPQIISALFFTTYDFAVLKMGLERMRACAGDVLIVHDTTELDYTTRESLEGLGQIGNGSRRGTLRSEI